MLPAGDAAKVARGIDGIIDRRSGCGRRGGSGIGVPGLLRELIQIVMVFLLLAMLDSISWLPLHIRRYVLLPE